MQSFQRRFLKSTGGSCPIPPAQDERVEIEEEGEKIEEKSFLERVVSVCHPSPPCIKNGRVSLPPEAIHCLIPVNLYPLSLGSQGLVRGAMAREAREGKAEKEEGCRAVDGLSPEGATELVEGFL